METSIGIAFNLLKISSNRQRKEFEPESIVELHTSISQIGLLHKIVVRETEGGQFELIAGERRLRAMENLWMLGKSVRCENQIYPPYFVPCSLLQELSPLEALQAEVEENTVRKDFTWQEAAQAKAELLKLRTMQAEQGLVAPPTISSITKQVYGVSNNRRDNEVRKELILANHLDNPLVNKAANAKEAFKILKRQEELQTSAALGKSVGATYTSAVHTLYNTDCLEWMKHQPLGQFDVILTDPPYGMDADQFGDSGGKSKGEHFYKDDWLSIHDILEEFLRRAFLISKEQAHLYMFCDIDKFSYLKVLAGDIGWNVFRTPLTWFNPGAIRAPWPEQGPQRKSQWILYATKGNKPCTKLYGDVLTYGSDKNLNHQAQKPVDLYRDLLARSCRPGDKVLDAFCGTGPIFPAAHSLKLIATGIELDPAAYGITIARLGELK